MSFDPALTSTPPQFVIQRAAYGSGKDVRFETLQPGVQKVGIRGAYQYLLSTYPWKNQADAFLAIVKDRGFHFYVCDFEGTNNVLSVDFAASAVEWMRYVKTQTGKPVLIYSNYSTYIDYLSKDARIKEFPFWISRPLSGTIPDPQTYSPVMPPMRSDWLICQYSFGEHNTAGPANGVGRTGCDLDVFNGSIDDMKNWLGLTTPTPPVEPTPGEKLVILWREAELHGWNLNK